ncbi:MAG: glycosyltransferase [Bacteroidia bacterium]|nr:glycosyltransferase [Bacteroidia bacterium]
MRKVLIITYYWPPSGGAGVQRWLRMVKHLRKFDWEPIIFAPKDAGYPVLDKKLEATIPEDVLTLRLKIIEPNNFIKKFFFWKKDGEKTVYKFQELKGKNRSLLQKIMWFLRGNLFIPDARALWIKPSIKFLSKAVKKHDIDLVISTGPPHSTHLIAQGIHKRFGIPWIADFRDPWTSLDYLEEMHLTKAARQKHQKLEKLVIQSADSVLVVGRTMHDEYREKYGVHSEILHNGYDEAVPFTHKPPLDSKFTIVHIGSFKKSRNCEDLWKVLSTLVDEDQNFAKHLEIKLIGKTEDPVVESIRKYQLEQYLNHISYIPYEQTQPHLHSAQMLLLPIDRVPNAIHILTGKIFEYLKSNRPVLLIGPVKGDAADIIQECTAGYCCDFEDLSAIRKAVLDSYHKFLSDKNHIQSSGVDRYSAFELTKKLSSIMNKTIGSEIIVEANH